MPRPLSQLTIYELTALVREIVSSSGSEEEIRRKLYKAGFNTDKAVVVCQKDAEVGFLGTVVAFGPRDEIVVV